MVLYGDVLRDEIGRRMQVAVDLAFEQVFQIQCADDKQALELVHAVHIRCIA
jgi:hypothetical protein